MAEKEYAKGVAMDADEEIFVKTADGKRLYINLLQFYALKNFFDGNIRIELAEEYKNSEKKKQALLRKFGLTEQ